MQPFLCYNALLVIKSFCKLGRKMNHHKQSQRNFFTNISVDRLALKRHDEAWFMAQIHDPKTKFVQ